MKEDKSKEAKLEAVKKELNNKIEHLMGPTTEDQAPANKRISPAKAADPNARRKPEDIETSTPTTAPEVANNPPVKEPKAPTPQAPPTPEEPADTELDSAVDDIAASEGDELLKAEDEAVQKAFVPQAPKTLGQKIKAFFKNWLGNRRNRNLTFLILGIAIAVVAVVPTTRYFVLNSVGVRSSASLTVLDESTRQPLKNVTVTLSGQSGETNEEGYVQLHNIRLGKNELTIERRAFATTTKPLTIGWGSNPLGDFQLAPTGLQYSFKVTDFLSNKPIQKAELTSAYASAFSDEEGNVVLTLDGTGEENVKVKIVAEGYRTETLTATADQEVMDVKMAAYKKHAFVSKRSGKFDIYKIDADGKNEELALAGTGAERDDMVLAPHPSQDVTALVSTRENMRDEKGYLLSTLTMLNLDTNKADNLGLAEKYQIVGWVDDRLVYVRIAPNADGEDPHRQKLMSYDYQSGDTNELASTNYFNDVLVAQNKIYYAPSSAFQDKADVKLFVMDADGSNKRALIDSETWNLFRTDYDTLVIAVGQAWHEYTLGSNEAPTSLSGAPADPASRIYSNSPDSQHSLWADQRDGKGVLLVYALSAQKDTTLTSQSGLGNPVQWLNNTTAVYRIKTDQETADYIVSTEGGEAKKLVDVTHTAGIDNWYYH